jgi:23S rRNA pseudouridine1911/1915/1917 synthase
MKHIGHPLFADEAYGGMKILKTSKLPKYEQFIQNCFTILSRQALHAKTLGFIHPKSKQFIHFESELPEDISAVLDKMRQYTKD